MYMPVDVTSGSTVSSVQERSKRCWNECCGISSGKLTVSQRYLYIKSLIGLSQTHAIWCNFYMLTPPMCFNEPQFTNMI